MRGAAGAVAGALAAGLATAACTAEKHAATPDTARVAGAARSAPPSDTSAVFKPVSDGDVRMLTALVNSSEVAAGATAARKATDTDVRAFGREMVADHTAMQQSVGADTSAGRGTTPAGHARADTLRRVAERQSDSLAALAPGSAFDRAYIDQQISGHSMALDSLVRWRADARSAALRTVIDSAVAKVQSHLDRARAIQASLGGMYRRPVSTPPDTSRPRPDTAARPSPGADTSRR
jgi:putative membrane protein